MFSPHLESTPPRFGGDVLIKIQCLERSAKPFPDSDRADVIFLGPRSRYLGGRPPPFNPAPWKSRWRGGRAARAARTPPFNPGPPGNLEIHWFNKQIQWLRGGPRLKGYSHLERSVCTNEFSALDMQKCFRRTWKAPPRALGATF